MVVIIVAREFAVSALRSVAAAAEPGDPGRALGQDQDRVQIVAIALAHHLRDQLGEFRQLAPICLWAAVLVTLYSGIEYFVRYGRMVVRAK